MASQFFLPTMPTPIPHPGSEQFFRCYREPVEAFLAVSASLYWAATDALDDRNYEALRLIVAGHVDEMMRATADGPRFDAPRYGSLIAAIADLFCHDLVGGFRFFDCEQCKIFARTDSTRAKFCSRQCKWIAAQKAHRERLAREETNTNRRSAK